MRYLIRTLPVAAILFLACAKKEAPADSTSAANQPAGSTAAKLGEATGMKTPESVRYDPELDVYYISNINGNPSQHDNNGFIAILRADSISPSGAPMKMLVEGGKNGVTLDAPKGLALSGDTLWVADINHVRAFDRKTGAKLADIDLTEQKATFLNDVAIGGDGSVYVTDTGIAFNATGGQTHPGTDQIFKISGGRTSVLRPDSLYSPNGITWDKANSRFILGGFAAKGVQAWKEGDKQPTTLADGPGQYDGVEVLADGRILVSSWADGTVNVVQNGKLSKLVGDVSAPADIGVDTKRNVLAVPRFNDGKIDFFKIP
ncbi:MAG TPA: SMP-30/gluconolactonase/LRE family protein [Gemmatimonadaceae bacterium]|jgi:sugar lactone lactonase YvrE|nr:SMP-30/gluconolactonase/LRE family protein [Gemmatimonadaceae bacterium]